MNERLDNRGLEEVQTPGQREALRNSLGAKIGCRSIFPILESINTSPVGNGTQNKNELNKRTFYLFLILPFFVLRRKCYKECDP